MGSQDRRCLRAGPSRKPQGRTKERRTHERWELPAVLGCFRWDSSAPAPDRPANLTGVSPESRRSTSVPGTEVLRRDSGGAMELSACGPCKQGIPPGAAKNRANPRKHLKIRGLRWLLRNTTRRADTQFSQVRLPRRTRRSTGSAASRDRARSTSNSATQSLCSSGSTSICWTRQVRLSSAGTT